MGNNSTTETMASAFQRLQGKSPSPENLAILLKLQKYLNIPDDDPLWSLIIAFDYYRDLYETIPKEIDDRLMQLRGLLDDFSKAGGTLPLPTAEKPLKSRKKWIFAALASTTAVLAIAAILSNKTVVVTTLSRDEIKDLESCWKGAGKTQEQDGHLVCFPVVTTKNGGRVIGYRLR